jgi:hypothetical protein
MFASKAMKCEKANKNASELYIHGILGIGKNGHLEGRSMLRPSEGKGSAYTVSAFLCR